MSGSQLLRLRVNERLEAAVEEIFGLVEKTITEYEEEAVRSKREIGQLKQQLEQLVVLRPKVILNRTDTQPIFKTQPPSLQQYQIKVEEIPVLEEAEVQEHPRVKEEQAERRLSPDMQEICPSQVPDCLVTRDAEQIKEEQVEMSISPDVEADAFNVDEVGDPDSEPDEYCEPLPSSMAESVNDNGRTEMDRSSSPLQGRSAELEQPPRGDRSCRFCGEIFMKDSFLIKHVATSHKGHKAFRCLECKKEFEQRIRMVMHARIHTGEKPFSCNYCDKTFTQSSGRIYHMRKHTREKPSTIQKEALTCFKCNKEFKRKKQLVLHLRVHRCENPFRCDFCGKVFAWNASRVAHMKRHTSVHNGVHNGRQPFGCGFFDDGFTRKSARIIHMREHAGEKPYPCEKCGKGFTSRGNCARHAECCTGTRHTNDLAAQHVAEPFTQQLQVQE